MALKITRCPENPIVWPGKWDWRMSNVYNPAAIYEDGRFYLYERTAGSLRPHHCYVGLIESEGRAFPSLVGQACHEPRDGRL